MTELPGVPADGRPGAGRALRGNRLEQEEVYGPDLAGIEKLAKKVDVAFHQARVGSYIRLIFLKLLHLVVYRRKYLCNGLVVGGA